jgi:Trypsin-like peptidase domain
MNETHSATGVLVGREWLITAAHVLRDELAATEKHACFNLTRRGAIKHRRVFAFDPFHPEGGYFADPILDFVLVRLRPDENGKLPEDFGIPFVSQFANTPNTEDAHVQAIGYPTIDSTGNAFRQTTIEGEVWLWDSVNPTAASTTARPGLHYFAEMQGARPGFSGGLLTTLQADLFLGLVTEAGSSDRFMVGEQSIPGVYGIQARQIHAALIAANFDLSKVPGLSQALEG